MELKALLENTKKEDNTTFRDIVPTNALVTKVSMCNGNEATITTLFCCTDFRFEDINIGVNTAIARQNWLPIEATQSTLYSLEGGTLTVKAQFEKQRRRR